MKKVLLILGIGFFLGGCVHTPYASVGASKSINVGGINVGVGVHDILRLGK
jgi:PBP1b-binding outer membrane lipoprotein LpoB